MHPVAWWAWAAGVVVLAGRTGAGPVLAVLLAACAAVAVVARRRGGPPVTGYLVLAAAVLVVRLVFHVLVGIPGSGTVLLDLPGWRPSWAVGVVLLGPVTTGGLATAAIGGLQLATMVLAVGAAATASPPTRLLGVLPAALHHVATAVVIAVGVLPSLAAAARGARRARRLRGLPTRGARAVAQSAVPVLADALDRSLALAASMDARGYARLAGEADRRVIPLLLVALLGGGLGTYGLLSGDHPLGATGLGGAALAGAVAARLGGARSERTRYRPEQWGPRAVALTALGAAVATGAVTGAPAGLLAVLAAAGTLGLVPGPALPVVRLPGRPA